ncbi:NADH-quinone oxidoreductase subunit NuoN [Croceicoccus sediminis]|uniref:NADH-quinone oxidoreductase subunit NuoN n=1 Tax=Croceicoccus sediminis TaxID=2571150 RepID=UPI00118343AE|nr:NADH-quinone oxidoreductase subunit NuoN [Croceicoccus sediminis]
MTDFSQSLALIAAEELLTVVGLVLLLCAAWMGDKASRMISIVAVAALVACAFIAAPALCGGLMGPERVAFMGQYTADAFAAFAKLLIYASGIASLIVAPRFFGQVGAMRAEYPILILFAVLGMNMMVSATDFLTLYIGLELNSLAAYVLASFLRNDERSAEAGLKYFVLGALASGIILFGMSLTYGFTGSTNFTAVALAMDGTLATGALFGLIFVLAGLAFKISAVPFHMWTPDVYEGAPTPVTTFFATAPKVAALALTMRVALGAFGTQVDAWQQIVIFVSLASIVVGALGAIGQSNIKRLLAYSSINNVGFLLIGLAAATQEGASAMLVYLAIYVAMSVAGFVVVLMLRDAEGRPVEVIADMAGLSRTRPALAWALAAVMFSLAGIPPLFGFWGKFVVFQAAVNADLIALAAIGIAASVIGAFYYLKVVKIVFFDEPANVVAESGESGVDALAHKVMLLIACLFISPLGYLLTPWLGELADKAAAALYFVG